MKTILSIAAALTLIGFAGSTLAADAEKGKEVFSSNCVACHSGGKNAMAADKSLSKEDMEKNGVNSEKAIIDLVTNGKPPMPGFGAQGTISAPDIENVAAYVLKKSASGW